MRATALLVLVTVTVTFGASVASADKKTDLQQARAHFKAGEAFFNAGIWDRAIDEYKAAYAISSRPQLLFNLGATFRRKADASHASIDLRAAVEHYQRYLDADPEGVGAEDARAYLVKLRADLASAERLEAMNPRPLPPPVEPPPVVAPPPVEREPRPDLTTDNGASRRARGWRTAGWITGGAGAVLVGTGVVFGVLARSASDDLQGLEPGDAWDQSRYDSGRRNQVFMATLLGVGGVALIAGGVMVFVLGKERPVRVQTTGTSVSLSGRF